MAIFGKNSGSGKKDNQDQKIIKEYETELAKEKSSLKIVNEKIVALNILLVKGDSVISLESQCETSKKLIDESKVQLKAVNADLGNNTLNRDKASKDLDEAPMKGRVAKRETVANFEAQAKELNAKKKKLDDIIKVEEGKIKEAEDKILLLNKEKTILNSAIRKKFKDITDQDILNPMGVKKELTEEKNRREALIAEIEANLENYKRIAKGGRISTVSNKSENSQDANTVKNTVPSKAVADQTKSEINKTSQEPALEMAGRLVNETRLNGRRSSAPPAYSNLVQQSDWDTWKNSYATTRQYNINPSSEKTVFESSKGSIEVDNKGVRAFLSSEAINSKEHRSKFVGDSVDLLLKTTNGKEPFGYYIGSKSDPELCALAEINLAKKLEIFRNEQKAKDPECKVSQAKINGKTIEAILGKPPSLEIEKKNDDEPGPSGPRFHPE